MIRKTFLLSMIFAATITMAAAKTDFKVSEIQPPHWWTGMKDTSLQLQVYGKDIRDTEVSISYPGVTIDSVVRLDGSPNWQYLYLNVTPEARSGDMKIVWRKGKRTLSKEYPLLQRHTNRGTQGFNAGDLLYLVMPDRFADGDAGNNVVSDMRYPAEVDRDNPNIRHGGDLQGMMQHLDYIDSLGVTAVWFNPVLENDMPWGSYHGYATTDYYRIDPRFGSNDDYTAIIDSLHNRGIKTVMDMIFNHCGSAHRWFEERPSSDWFNFPDGYVQTNYRLSTVSDPYASQRDRQVTQDGWFVEAMPDLNQRNPHLMKYLVQNSIWWIEESGIDGIRMDTYPYADERQMGKWVDAVLNEYPDFNIVGECWFGTPAGESYWQKGSATAAASGFDPKLPTVMDFPLMIESRNLKPFIEDTDPWNGLNKIYDHFALDFIYKDPMKVLRFLDNHDTERMILETPDRLDNWKQAITVLLTAPGIPQIYYGTELLMSGDRKGGDGMIRKDIPGGFPGDTVNNFKRSGRSELQNEAYDFISRLANWRKRSPQIAEGGMMHFMPDNGIYLYRRGDQDNPVIVVMNGRDIELTADMSRYAEVLDKGVEWIDVLSGETVVLRPDSDRFVFKPRATMVLELKNKR